MTVFEGVPAEVIDEFEREFGVVILEGYGLSETASTTTFNIGAEERRFRAHLAGRLPLIPRYRQKARAVPPDLGAPVWVDDLHFALDRHLVRTALPAPGGDAELRALMGRVMSQRLDRDRPLWQYWLVQGLAGGRWALVSKVHHCMVDGISGTDLHNVVLDPTPAPRAPVPDLIGAVMLLVGGDTALTGIQN